MVAKSEPRNGPRSGIRRSDRRRRVSPLSDQPNEHRVVGARLRDARLAMGLTQADVADALGLSRPTLAAVEKGTRKITGLELRRLARLYQRDVAWLLGEEEPEAAAGSALHRATANLTNADKEQVLRFAEFLAAQQRTEDGTNTRSRPRPPEEEPT
ncbi:MAG: helix-turn-helix domain-containing protein [Jatrophihabitans sp.]